MIQNWKNDLLSKFQKSINRILICFNRISLFTILWYVLYSLHKLVVKYILSIWSLNFTKYIWSSTKFMIVFGWKIKIESSLTRSIIRVHTLELLTLKKLNNSKIRYFNNHCFNIFILLRYAILSHRHKSNLSQFLS